MHVDSLPMSAIAVLLKLWVPGRGGLLTGQRIDT